MKHTDYLVSGTPEACLAKIEQHLRDEWPSMEGNLPTGFSRPAFADNMVQYFKARRTLLSSVTGLLILIVLSIITLGSFTVMYIIYFYGFRFNPKIEMQIIAAINAPGETRLTVRTDNALYAERMGAFIQNELIENQAVAWSSDVSIDSKSIPEQIGALADLRDKGILTPEEFESKKSELLKKM